MYKDTHIQPQEMNNKRTQSIQSTVAYGYVGNRSAISAQESCGVEGDPIHTVQFSNHGGYPYFSGTKLTGDDIQKVIDGLLKNNFANYDAILTGYLGSLEIAEKIIEVLNKISKVCKKQPIYICDPVFGESGKVYMPKSFIDIYRTTQIPKAYLVTPNQTEAEELSYKKIFSIDDAIQASKLIHDLGVPYVIISSYEFDSTQEISDLQISEGLNEKEKLLENEYKTYDILKPCGILHSLLSFYSNETQLYTLYDVCMPKYPKYISGTGDLLTALICGMICNNIPVKDAWIHALESTQAILRQTLLRNRSELALVQAQEFLRKPQLHLNPRRI